MPFLRYRECSIAAGMVILIRLCKDSDTKKNRALAEDARRDSCEPETVPRRFHEQAKGLFAY